MTSSVRQEKIRSGTQSHQGRGAIGIISTGPGEDEAGLAILSVRPEGEEARRERLHPGEQFSFGDEVWELTEIDRPGNPRSWVTITRVS